MSINTGNTDVDFFLSKLYSGLNYINYDGSLLTVDSNIEDEKINKLFSFSNNVIGNKVEIKLSSCVVKNTFFFFNLKDFIQKYFSVRDVFDKSLIVILRENDFLYKSPESEYLEYNKSIYNIHEYNLVLDHFIKSKDFTPYVDEINDRFAIISKTNGVFNIGYKFPDLSFYNEVNLKGLYERIIKEFKKKEFVQFFKEILINAIHNTNEEYRFNAILKEHNILLNLTNRDYETYISNFAFDKIKSKFKEEREKYFETIDRNIGSIGKQVVSFPLTFGATIFASYKVKDQPQFLALILVGYFLYTIIAFLVLRMTSFNVKCLQEDVEKEENIIKASYNMIFEEFESDFQKIKTKISNLKDIIKMLFGVLILLLLLFAIYTFYHLDICVEFLGCSNL